MPPDSFERELTDSVKNGSEQEELVAESVSASCSVHSVNSSLPVVFVEGFMGSGKPKNWGPLAEIFKNSGIDPKCDRKLIFVKPGCCNSLHDRAIEIFYQTKGGRGKKCSLVR